MVQGMAFAFSVWTAQRAIDETLQEVLNKRLREVVSEMDLLLQDPTWTSPEKLKAVYELAWGKAPKSSTFLNDNLFRCFFRDYIIETGNDTYGFMESPWTTSMRSCVSQKGQWIIASRLPDLQMFLQEQVLKDLVKVGELVRGTLRGWDTLKVEEKQICRQHNKSYGWPQVNDLNFQKVLGWHNGGINQSIQMHLQ